MITLVIVLSLMLAATPLSAQSIKPLYQLPSASSGGSESGQILVGSEDGLFRITSSNNAIPVWTEGRVDQIARVEKTSLASEDGWFLRTTKGIWFTSDLKTFEDRNNGLPFLTVKKYDGKTAHTEKQIHNIEDMCINPMNHNEIVVATKQAVYLSRDGGHSWKSYGSMSVNTPGIKAVAVATINSQTVIFMSHPILGFSYIMPDSDKPKWIDNDKDFARMPSLTSGDEISDILPRLVRTKDGRTETEILISQTFLPRIYKFNWETKTAEMIYKGREMLDVIDGLTLVDDVLLYTTIEGFGSLDLHSYESPGRPGAEEEWHKAFSSVPGMISTAWIPRNRSGFNRAVSLNELWLLYPGTINTPYAEIADGKKAVYASA